MIITGRLALLRFSAVELEYNAVEPIEGKPKRFAPLYSN